MDSCSLISSLNEEKFLELLDSIIVQMSELFGGVETDTFFYELVEQSIRRIYTDNDTAMDWQNNSTICMDSDQVKRLEEFKPTINAIFERIEDNLGYVVAQRIMYAIWHKVGVRIGKFSQRQGNKLQIIPGTVQEQKESANKVNESVKSKEQSAIEKYRDVDFLNESTNEHKLKKTLIKCEKGRLEDIGRSLSIYDKIFAVHHEDVKPIIARQQKESELTYSQGTNSGEEMAKEDLSNRKELSVLDNTYANDYEDVILIKPTVGQKHAEQIFIPANCTDSEGEIEKDLALIDDQQLSVYDKIFANDHEKLILTNIKNVQKQKDTSLKRASVKMISKDLVDKENSSNHQLKV